MSKKSTKALASATLMSLVLTTALSGAPVKAAAGQVSRVGEADRYSTAAKVATTNWTTSENVVLVSGEGYADAVSASALAKKLNAPILLTTAGSLNTDTKEALSKLSAKNIYVVGGKASVSASVRAELKAKYNVEELGGLNRYETNAAVAQKLVDLGVDASNAIMVGGEGFSDALSVAPVAAAKGQILLLGMNDANYMKPVLDFVAKNKSKVTVVGTKNVISDSILAQVNGTRVDGGKDRWDTNLKVLAAFKDSVKMDKMYVASAAYNAQDNGYADALVASALAGKTASPLILVDKDGNEGTTNAVTYIKSNADPKKSEINVIGGTGVVSETTVEAINKALHGGPVTENTTVSSIEPISLNQFKVHFNCAVDADAVENVTNYKIDGTQLTETKDDVAQNADAAVAKSLDDNTVLVTLAHPRKQSDKVTVSVKKAIVTKDKNSTVEAYDQDVTFKDVDAPTLEKVTVEGNSQLTVEFSEAVNMKTINELKDKFKIDGQNISNYSVNTEYSKIKNKIVVDNADYGQKAVWSKKVLFYFDSTISAGNHTLKITAGDKDGVLSDAAGWTLAETSKDFTVDSVTTKPTAKSVKQTKSGEISITFDRAMDVQTASNLSNYEINGQKISGSKVEFDTDNDDTVILLKKANSFIKTGSNTVYIKDSVKDAFGNKVPDDTRLPFDDVKDETKPKITSYQIVDSETIRINFSKDVDFSYANNRSNYKLVDGKNVDITNHIRGIYNTIGESNRDNGNSFNIKLEKFNPNNSNEDWRLTGGKYTLTVKNIIDTASKPNTMDEWNQVISGTDTVAPKATGTYAKARPSSSEKDKVIIYFTEAMDSSTLTNKDNYKFVNGEGDSKTLPSEATISAGGDQKSAIIEFPSSYHVKTTGKITNGSTNDVTAVRVSNVKDLAGNILDSISFDNNSKIDVAKAGAQVKDNTVKVYHDGDDLKAEVQFDRAIDTITASDFTLGGVHPTSARPNGDKAVLTFKDGAALTKDDGVQSVTYANKKTNTSPTKIDALKAQGQNAKLTVVSTGTTDETGAKVATDNNGASKELTVEQSRIYDNQAAPKTASDYWTAEKDNSGAKVYLTFDTIIDVNSGIKTDDFTFTGEAGTTIKADSLKVEGNTVVFTFNKTNNDYKAFSGTKLDIAVKNSAQVRTVRDFDGNQANYVPSSDDIKTRTINVTGVTDPSTPAGKVTVEEAGTAILGKTIVVASLDSALDATKYDVTIDGKALAYDASSKKFTITLDGTFTKEQLQAKIVATEKKVVAVPKATVEQAGTAILGKTIVVASLPADVDASKFAVKVDGTALTYDDSSKKFTGTLDGTFTVEQLQAKIAVSAL